MTLPVDAQTTLAAINHAFKSQYPYLSIQFFSDGEMNDRSDSADEALDLSIRLGMLSRKNLETNVIELHFWQLTADAERILSNKLGIRAQIYRRHDEEWIQTAGSDGLTLEQQNELGAQSLKDNAPLHVREKPL
jgi:hypothetical protein